MNFYELFEKKDDKDHQEVTIADPKAALALKTARAKYTYAKSDLEAFIKQTQDDEEEDQKEINKIEKDNKRQEEDIKELEQQERKNSQEIDRLEQVNNQLERSVKLLGAKEEAYEKKVQSMAKAERAYKDQIEKLQLDLDNLEHRLREIPGFTPKTSSSIVTPVKLPEPIEFEPPQAV